MAKILIVEDSPTQLEGLKRAVEHMGHLPFCAQDGDQAIEMALEVNPDLILMDVIMPNNNGFQATRTLSKNKQTSHIPVVILTSKTGEADRLWGLRQGAKEYLTKPVDPTHLTTVIEHLLEKSGTGTPTAD